MLSLVLAEKPTLARLIARSLPEEHFKTQEGYYEGEHYIITYAFGHLFEEYDIEDYIGEEGKKWSLDILPFCPPDGVFKFRLIQKRNKDGKKATDPGIKKQFNTIRSLIARKDVGTIIHAGDADREGEILIRLVVRNANPENKPVYRLWVQEQTENEMRKGLRNLRHDSEYDDLSNEGFARAYTDWLDGINLTRYFSIKAKAPVGKPFRLGRVICAMVKEIYDRDMEIENFVPVDFFMVKSSEKTKGTEIQLTSQARYSVDQEAEAQAHCDRLNAAPATVISVEKKQHVVSPGKLFSLTSLQNTLYKYYGIPLAKSKSLIQDVYEAGYITYPRTNTEYLGESEKEKVAGLLDRFSKKGFNVIFKDTKRIFDSSKIESHSAIIPTYKIPEKPLEKDAQLVYETVRNRFLAVFAKEQCITDRTVMLIECAGEQFKLQGDVLKQPGFLNYEPQVKVSEKTLPPLEKGDLVEHMFAPSKEQTKPPAHYTATTFNSFLLSPFGKKSTSGTATDPEAVGDEELYKDIIDGVEIGTVASRTDIITKIIANGYINENKSVYTIAPTGKYLIESMALLGIKVDKETTVEMSKRLKEVRKGLLEVQDMVDISMYKLEKIMENRDSSIPSCIDAGIYSSASGAEPLGKCPLCGGNVFARAKTYSCENNKMKDGTCNFVIFKQDKFFTLRTHRDITEAQVKKILHSNAVQVTCYKKDSGDKYQAIIRLNGMNERGFPNWEMEFPKRKRD